MALVQTPCEPMQPANRHRLSTIPHFVNHTPRLFELPRPASTTFTATPPSPDESSKQPNPATADRQPKLTEKSSITLVTGSPKALLLDVPPVKSDHPIPEPKEDDTDNITTEDESDMAPLSPILVEQTTTVRNERLSQIRYPSWEMQYFLRHTGPTTVHSAPRSVRNGHQRFAPRKAIKLLKRNNRRHNGSKSSHESKIPGPPPKGTVRKVSKGGKMYLQIVGDDANKADTSTPRPSDGRWSLSLAPLGTDALDTWISTLSLQQQKDEEDATVKLLQRNTEDKSSSAAATDGSSGATSETPSSRPMATTDGELRVDIKPMRSSTPSIDIDTALHSHPCDVPSPFACPEKLLPLAYPANGKAQRCSATLRAFPAPSTNIFPQQKQHATEKPLDRSSSTHLPKTVQERNRPLVLRSPSVPPRSPLRLANGNPVDSPMEGKPQEASTAGPLRPSRDEKIRARKLRDLERSRHSQTIDEVIQGPIEATKVLLESLKDDPVSMDSTRLRPPPLDTSAAKLSEKTDTRNTPISSDSRITLSPVMLVAEQVPLPKTTKTANKPARLVLREGKNRPNAVAVRTDSPDHSAPPSCESTTRRPSPARPSPAGSLPRRTAFPALGAVHANQRASLYSNQTSSSREARLEARLEALERENKLLEAALMAVLKTSGTLNKCPCQVQLGHSHAVEGSKRFSRVSAGSSGTKGSTGGASALELYLNTRMGSGRP